MRSRVISLVPDCHLQRQFCGCKYKDFGIAIHNSYGITKSTIVVNLWGLA
jgi:hypothetical protein